MEDSTLEWFGATTFRLRIRGVTVFLDTWLDRPSVLKTYLPVDKVKEADYIFISHAHFDHLPGADRIAIRTGAIVIANNEATNLLREGGVPEHQLLPVQGGERIPLFTRETWNKANANPSLFCPGPPGAPRRPLDKLAAFSVDVWPSLHCMMPTDHPEVIDTATVYKGSASPYSCTLDITIGMKYGLLKIGELMPAEKLTPGHRSFIEYVGDRKRNLFSHSDGGQLMFNFVIGEKAFLWSAHLGGYEGILRDLQPKPDIAILAIAGRANVNGRPFDGSAAEFAAMKVGWLGNPSQVIWCLHDEACIPPWRIKTEAATKAVEKNGKTKVLTMDFARPVTLDI
ncbi:hypothetical protein BFJ63_vAg7107 [Fusarium oxysporum f. sp. narcissi]|uniref:Metallo-beta-lactamase domain-containing protein n=1 Tax=Fusarium oxysporum f. sp. narcissi TaxID=451672 RepID=A0A4Q2VTS3_FUSOX|nr:hypothetical protein BFJ63_vAg7107 [Fusarium oxysporum f. sp. narcissi]